MRPDFHPGPPVNNNNNPSMQPFFGPWRYQGHPQHCGGRVGGGGGPRNFRLEAPPTSMYNHQQRQQHPGPGHGNGGGAFIRTVDKQGYEKETAGVTVAVGSKSMEQVKPWTPFQNNRNNEHGQEEKPLNNPIYSSDEENQGSSGESVDVEEYEPENPAILGDPFEIRLKVEDHCGGLIKEATATELVVVNALSPMVSCDEDGFFEAWVAIAVSKYPLTLGRQVEVAGYGVWFTEENKRYDLAIKILMSLLYD